MRLLFLVGLLVGSLSAVTQVWAQDTPLPAEATFTAILLACLVVPRMLEFRTGRLMPVGVDLLELVAAASMLVAARRLDPVIAPVFFALLFRAARRTCWAPHSPPPWPNAAPA
ncbi:hypothetical protein GCM10009828_095050 [Actinoplanes couchii]|uniref:Uncharacterized protein n=1 Tax=Actinoplanes couchii TaxID=403638 RepID=A0ABQ3XSX9_9ACTN|nr:hypothetical protein Aco03nite_099340 [Actinoplanes couchii]